MKEAVQAKQQEDRMFIMQPMGPVALMVTISMRATTAAIRKEDRGPKMKPPTAMTMSLGS